MKYVVHVAHKGVADGKNQWLAVTVLHIFAVGN